MRPRPLRDNPSFNPKNCPKFLRAPYNHGHPNLRSRAGASQWTLGFAPTQAPSDTAPTFAGPQYTSTQYSQAFPAGGLYVEGPPPLSPIPTGSQITYSQALQLVSTPVGAGASLVSEDTLLKGSGLTAVV